MDRAVDFDVVLADMNGFDWDGTPRQEILAECLADCSKSLYWCENPRNLGRVGIFVQLLSDDGRVRFPLVGELPPKYFRFWKTGWNFECRTYEITKDGETLGMRVRGRFVPPAARADHPGLLGYDL